MQSWAAPGRGLWHDRTLPAKDTRVEGRGCHADGGWSKSLPMAERWSKDKLQLPEGSAPGPRRRSQDSRSAQRNKRGCKPAGGSHFWTVLELVHLGLQHAMLSKHRFANAAHRRACSSSFPSWSLLQRAACCRTVTQGWDACPAAPATCSPCCGSGCLGWGLSRANFPVSGRKLALVPANNACPPV